MTMPHIIRRATALAGAFVATLSIPSGGQARPPIIDMHVHAHAADAEGPSPQFVCPGTGELVAPRRVDSTTTRELMQCDRPLRSAATDDEVRVRTLAIMKRYNVIGVTSGPHRLVRQWHDAAPDRIIPAATAEPLDSLRRWAKAGKLAVIGELAFQYAGIGPGDSVPRKYFALAEELDIPVAIHVGPGPPGAPYLGAPRYRMRLSDPLALEDVLAAHPRLRLYVMHAGWPMIDHMIGLLWAYPQVYVDIGVISWALPRREFYGYLRRLVDAGFGTRIMFGSDQMVWPEAMEIAIQNIERADFLTAKQKRDILYNNAATFLRLPNVKEEPQRR